MFLNDFNFNHANLTCPIPKERPLALPSQAPLDPDFIQFSRSVVGTSIPRESPNLQGFVTIQEVIDFMYENISMDSVIILLQLIMLAVVAWRGGYRNP